jgi:hypothetical protein
LRVKAHHEGFHDMPLPGHPAQPFRIRRIHADRLLAQHMLAGVHRRDSPLDMQVVGKRVVDGVDIGIGQKLLIGAVGLGNAEFRGRSLGPVRIPRGNRIDCPKL